MNILAIVGSPRPDGSTSYLVDQTLKESARLGAKTEKIILSKYKIGPCLAHKNCSELDSCARQDDGISLLKKFAEADGIVLGTPVYYYDVSAWLKIFIDRNYFLRQHGIKCSARAAGIIVVAGGAGIEETVRSLDRFIDGSSFNDIPGNKRFVVTGYTSGNADVKDNHKLVKAATELGANLVEALREEH